MIDKALENYRKNMNNKEKEILDFEKKYSIFVLMKA